MENKILILLVGVGLGYFLSTKLLRPSIPPEAPQLPMMNMSIESSISKKSSEVIHNSTIAASQNSTLSIHKPKQTATVILDEAAVAEFENQWNDLKNQARARYKDGGWEINLLKANSLFSKAGFHDGDFISYQTVMNGYSGEEGPALSQKIISIFNEISD